MRQLICCEIDYQSAGIMATRKDLTNDIFQADFCAERLKALSDPHRLRIVDVLREGELSVSDISARLNAEVVTISHHLKIMRQADLVEVRKEGRFMYYRLHDDVLVSRGKLGKFLDLGCCRLEVPQDPREPNESRK